MDYDMSGLGSFGALLDAQMVKGALMAGAVGGGGILLATTVIDKAWTQPTTGMFSATAEGGNGPMNFKRAKSALTVLLGIAGGRALYDRNRDAAMALTGAVTGLGMAELAASYINDPASTTGPTVRTSNLAGSFSLSDLRALEMAVSTPMASWRPAGGYDMAGLGGPVARTQQLQSPATSITELGAMSAYMPYLS